MSEVAIFGKKLQKSYQDRDGKLNVLKDLNILVLKGQIYGLLGSSGCGKTTLLDCITGIKDLDSGHLSVLGHKVPSKNGFSRAIGYMPQDTALVEALSIKEILTYFGIIYNLKPSVIKTKIAFLTKLLNLPPLTQAVNLCSGGEKRRVSFAATLIHDPQLLILDEPTVGLDSLLRSCIWNHLKDLAEREKRTILITTHYIEEARKADVVGLVRNGTIIAEESPRELLTAFNRETLEEVFLDLCSQRTASDSAECSDVIVNSNEKKIPKSDDDFINKIAVESQLWLNRRRKLSHYEELMNSCLPVKNENFVKNDMTWRRFRGMCLKNLLRSFKDYWHIFLLVIIPLTQTYFIMNVVGTDLNDLKVAVYNEEMPQSQKCYPVKNIQDFVSYDGRICKMNHISCDFLEHIDKKIKLMFYSKNEIGNLSDPKNPLYRKVDGILHIPKNFTKGFLMKIKSGIMIPDQDVTKGIINLYKADTSLTTSEILEMKLIDAFRNFGQKLSQVCHEHERLFTFPLLNPKIMQGDTHWIQVGIYFAGFTIVLMYANGMTLTSTLILDERINGFWNRNIIAGISPTEMLLSHYFYCLLATTIPMVVSLIAAVNLFGLTVKGSFLDMVILLWLASWNGSLAGTLISLECVSFIVAKLTTVALFFPFLYFSGILWPIESIPYPFRYLFYLSPMTYPHLALRDVIYRGLSWSTSNHLGNALLINVLWMVLMFGLTIARAHSKKMTIVPKRLF